MRHHWDAWKQLSQEFGFSLTVEQLLGLAGKPSKEIMELLCSEQVRASAVFGCPNNWHRKPSMESLRKLLL